MEGYSDSASHEEESSVKSLVIIFLNSSHAKPLTWV
jgi:hypothetical protein